MSNKANFDQTAGTPIPHIGSTQTTLNNPPAPDAGTQPGAPPAAPPAQQAAPPAAPPAQAQYTQPAPQAQTAPPPNAFDAEAEVINQQRGRLSALRREIELMAATRAIDATQSDDLLSKAAAAAKTPEATAELSAVIDTLAKQSVEDTKTESVDANGVRTVYRGGDPASQNAETQKLVMSMSIDLSKMTHLLPDVGKKANVDYGREVEANQEFCKVQTDIRVNGGGSSVSPTDSVILPYGALAKMQSAAMAFRTGNWNRHNALFSQDLTSLEGLTTTDRFASLYAEVIRPGSVLADLGPRFISVQNPTEFAVASSAIQAYWGTGSETTPAIASATASQKRNIRFRTIRVYVPITRDVLKLTDPSVLSISLQDAMNALSEKLCEGALTGTGSNEPTGVSNVTGIIPVTLDANSRTQSGNDAVSKPSFVEMIRHETAVRKALQNQGNVNPMSACYLTTSSVAGNLRTTTRGGGSSADTFIAAQQGSSMYPMIDGYKIVTYEGLPNDREIIFGMFSELIIASFGMGVEVRYDVNSQMAGDAKLGLFTDVDAIVRRTNAFAKSTASNA